MLEEISNKVKNGAIAILAGGAVLIDSISYFWSAAIDLLMVALLVLISKIKTKK